MSETRICLRCGKPITNPRSTKYCSRPCADSGWQASHRELINQQRRDKRRKLRIKESLSTSGKSIAEINREALAQGMTYGQYVMHLNNAAKWQQT